MSTSRNKPLAPIGMGLAAGPRSNNVMRLKKGVPC